MSIRDMQRSRVYKAERSISPGKAIPTINGVEAYLGKILNSKWWRDRFPRKTILKVKDGRGCRIARGFNGGASLVHLTLPKWSRLEIFILHELTHTVTSTNLAAHGPEFAGTFLELVARFMGQEAGEALRLAFVKYGVDYGYEIPLDLPLETIEILGEDGQKIQVGGTRGGKGKLWIRYLFPSGGTRTIYLTADTAVQAGEALRIVGRLARPK